MLKQIFGSGEDEDEGEALPRQRRPLTADRFRAMAASHNQKFKPRRGRKAHV